jgi:hypothetical protein
MLIFFTARFSLRLALILLWMHFLIHMVIFVAYTVILTETITHEDPHHACIDVRACLVTTRAVCGFPHVHFGANLSNMWGPNAERQWGISHDGDNF